MPDIATPVIANAILVYEENREVKHRFCPESEAREALERFKAELGVGTMLAADGIEFEFALKIAPSIQAQIDAAKAKMREDIRIRNALDRHGVPQDKELRGSINLAIGDILSGR